MSDITGYATQAFGEPGDESDAANYRPKEPPSMTDPLITAWNLLEPSERPEGMPEYLVNPDGERWYTANAAKHVTRDRLIVACEGVLMDLGWIHSRVWYRNGRMFEDGCGIYDPDRLQAAILALQAERGTHAK